MPNDFRTVNGVLVAKDALLLPGNTNTLQVVLGRRLLSTGPPTTVP